MACTLGMAMLDSPLWRESGPENFFAAAKRFVDRCLLSGSACGWACEAEGCRLLAFLLEACGGSPSFEELAAAASLDFTPTCLSCLA